MGRPARIQFPGACYFITLAGIADIFASDQDRRRFLDLLRAAKSRHGLKVFAYGLWPGKVLLVLRTARPNLAAAMQAFMTAYAKSKGRGPVFQGRYQALVVDQKRYLAELTRYVHLQPQGSPWSSLPAYAGKPDGITDAEEVLARFQGRPALYRRWLQERSRSSCRVILPVAGGVAVGDQFFLDILSSREPVEAPGPDLELARKIVARVAARHRLAQEQLLGRAQARNICVARREAVRLVWKEAGLTVTQLGRFFGRTPGSISQIVSELTKF